MPIERLAWLAAAVGLVGLVLIAPLPIPKGWDKAAHFAAFSALTLCLWQAAAGALPRLVPAAVVTLAALDEWRQAFIPGRMPDAGGFLVDLGAVLGTALLLAMQRKPVCAESSRR